MDGLALYLLGSPHIHFDQEALLVPDRKGLALLAYVALEGPQSRDTLAALLWPESGQERSRANLRYILWSLRKSLGAEWLHTSGDSVGLAPGAQVDVLEFRQLLAGWRAHAHPSGGVCPAWVQDLETAAKLYRDDFLHGFSLTDSPQFDEWQFFQSEGLRQDLAATLGALADHQMEEQQFAAAIPYARRRLTLDPMHEPAHRQLMTLYALSGQQTAALRQYEECVRILDAELGVEPEAQTTALVAELRVRRLDPSSESDSSGQAMIPPAPAVPALPQPATAFVGRRTELARMRTLLTEDPGCRLLSLVGPGGSGKSRLALQAGQMLQESFADGIAWIPLVSLHETERLPAALMAGLGQPIASVASSRVELLRFLADRTLLLILDNFEQLLAAASLLTEILTAAPGVKLLVTSRERLGLQEEWIFSLSGLDFPAHPELTDAGERSALQTDAIQVLAQCGRHFDPAFALKGEDLTAAVRICQLVEGMPLAIEQAMTWVRATSLQEIEAEVARGLDLLVSDFQDLPARHRSMRTVLDGSWLRLSEGERTILRQLSLFRGGFTREAATEVAGASLSGLASLVDHSWLIVDHAGRYSMHELSRQYADEKLASEHPAAAHESRMAVRRRFYAFFAAKMAEVMATRSQQINLLVGPLWPDRENVWLAWEWATAVQDAAALSDMAYMIWFSAVRLGIYRDAGGRLAQATASLRARSTTVGEDLISNQALVYLLAFQANVVAVVGALVHAQQLCTEAWRLLATLPLSPRQELAESLLADAQTYVSLSIGDFITVDKLLRDQAGWATTRHTPYPHEYMVLGSYYQGDLATADAAAQLAADQTNAPFLQVRAEIAAVQGDLALSEEYLTRQEKRIQQEMDAGKISAFGLLNLSTVLARAGVDLLSGRHGSARAAFAWALDAGQLSGYRLVCIRACHGLGMVDLAEGRPEAARRHFAETLRLAQETGRIPWEGAAHVGLGQAALDRKEPDAARRHFCAALAVLAQTQATPIQLEALAGLAYWLAGEGENQRSQELVALVTAHPAATYQTRQWVRQITGMAHEAGPEGESFEPVPFEQAPQIDSTIAQIMAEFG